MKKFTLPIVLGTSLTMPLFSSPVQQSPTQPSLELSCLSEDKSVEVLVVKEPKIGTTAFVIEKGFEIIVHEVTAEWVTDGANQSEQTRIFYKGGKIPRGGVNIRIITEKNAFPEVEGTGHVTFKGLEKIRNTFVKCNIYPI